MILLNENQLTLVAGASRNGDWEGYWGHSGGGSGKGKIVRQREMVTAVVAILAVTPVVATIVVQGNR